MAAFIQVVEYTTDRVEEIEALLDEWLARTQGQRTAQRMTLCADRDRPRTYVSIVEFPSHEEAMRNSALPETSDVAKRLAELCEVAPTFRDLDVVRLEEL